MATDEKNYRNNPYVYGIVNVLYSFCRDYGEAKRALENDPNDRRSMMVKCCCMEFADWMKEATGLDYPGVGELIERLMVTGNDEQ